MAQEEELIGDEMNNEKRCFSLIIIVEFFIAMVAICSGENLLTQISSRCVGFRFLGISLILIGVALLILLCTNCSVVNANDLAVANCKNLCCSVPLVLALVVFGIFALAVSSREGGGNSQSESSYKVYDVKSYSKWMQNKVTSNWENYYKKAVIKIKGIVCNKLSDISDVDPSFEIGCCQPPKECNFNHSTSSNVWSRPQKGNYTKDDDCNRWDNDPNILCFNCESCKAGFLQDITSTWFSTGLNLIMAVVLIMLLGIPFICFTMIGSGSVRGYMALA